MVISRPGSPKIYLGLHPIAHLKRWRKSRYFWNRSENRCKRVFLILIKPQWWWCLKMKAIRLKCMLLIVTKLTYRLPLRMILYKIIYRKPRKISWRAYLAPWSTERRTSSSSTYPKLRRKRLLLEKMMSCKFQMIMTRLYTAKTS